MSVNLLDLVKGAVGKQVLGQLGGILGESEKNVESAVGVAAPAILGGLLKRASEPNGPDEILKALKDHDGGILNDIGGVLGGSGREGLLEKGQVLLKMLFGSQQSMLIGLLSKAAGLKSGSAGSLLGMLAPIVMGVLGKQRAASGLDASGLANLLMSQKSHLASALPAEFSSQLGFSNMLGGVAKSAASAASGAGKAALSGAASAAQPSSGGMLKWFVPLLAVCGLGWLAYTYLGGSGVTIPKLDNPPSLSVPNVSLPKLEIPGMPDFSSKLESSFGSLTSAVEGITDEASARDALPQLQDVAAAFDGLGLASLPDAAKESVGGMLGPMLTKAKGLIETAYAIPGVRPILEPVVGPILQQLEAFAP